ncbi:WD40-repeat-containing domain protein [Powellomyces hirtus]|nr:WD40-repeat-containing domain protein [Powellomyces hirtus]
MAYALSAVLAGHETDVKAVLAVSNDELATASRDHTVMCWKRADKTDFLPEGQFRGHSHYVNALTYLKPTAEHPNGLFVSGGSDKTIQVFDAKHPTEPLYTLVGHAQNVCALTTTPHGDILSGSWDFTAKLWRNWECVATVEHQHSVWAVLGLADGTFLTGSADKSIKRWQGEKCLQTYAGHTDAVRGLAVLSHSSFVSCSNDGTLRIWSLQGECLNELNGHTSFIYSVSVSSSGEIASCGEDRSVRVWKGSHCVQTLFHPCPSVWSVTYLPNGDLLSGASDGFGRVFTRSQERLAVAEIQKAYEDSLASQSIPSNQVGDVDKSKLPGIEALERPGQKEGQVIMVNIGGSVEAHQWNGSEGKWHKIGEVVDAVGNQRKKQFQGQDYDFVFDVDMGDGVPPLQLPYNASENPYKAAQDFIWRNELPQAYLEQIADFITKNAGITTIGPESANYQDPFTGASRYVPGGAGARSTSLAPKSRSHAPATNGASKSLIPNTGYTLFKGANLAAISGKILQLNRDLEQSPENRAVALTAEEASVLEQTVKSLETPSKFRDTFSQRQFDVVAKVALQWPATERFPGIDVLRLAILHAPKTPVLDNIPKFLDAMAQLGNHPISVTPKVFETNAMLTMRFLANLFATEEGQSSLWNQRQEILDLVKNIRVTGDNKNLSVALATVLLNFATLTNTRSDDAFRVELLVVVIELLKRQSDAETCLRGLVGLGTLIYKSSEGKQAAQLMELDAVLEMKTTTPDIMQAVKEIKKLLVEA